MTLGSHADKEDGVPGPMGEHVLSPEGSPEEAWGGRPARLLMGRRGWSGGSWLSKVGYGHSAQPSKPTPALTLPDRDAAG